MAEQPAREVSHSASSPPKVSIRELAVFFLRLGCTAFGGPAAHIAMMEDELVRRREWLSRQKFLHLLGASNLIPGPSSPVNLPSTSAICSPARPGGAAGCCDRGFGGGGRYRASAISREFRLASAAWSDCGRGMECVSAALNACCARISVAAGFDEF
jgi:Chromate transporter